MTRLLRQGANAMMSGAGQEQGDAMAAAGRANQHLSVGTPVEVWNRFESSFVPGFEVSRDVEDGYRLRRRSDGVELPVKFTTDDVREIAHTA